MPFQKWKILLVVVASIATAACNQHQFGLIPQSTESEQKVKTNNQVDVLWVIDTSTSMSTHQNLLAAQVGSFIDAINLTGLDYHIAVTTMDMSNAGVRGRFLAEPGTPTVLVPTTPNLKSVLQNRLTPGENGSPIERGLEAMKASLTSPMIETFNAGFLRQDALLAVIFLSNEEDQSANEDYGAFLEQLRPTTPYGDRSWLVHFMGVVPSDPSCQSAQWQFSSPGLKYMDLATQSEGVTESICDANLARAVTNMRARILEILTTEFPFGNRTPKLDSIRVYVDGVLVPEDAANGWQYVSTNNSIRFFGTAIPKPDARIRIDWSPEGTL